MVLCSFNESVESEVLVCILEEFHWNLLPGHVRTPLQLCQGSLRGTTRCQWNWFVCLFSNYPRSINQNVLLAVLYLHSCFLGLSFSCFFFFAYPFPIQIDLLGDLHRFKVGGWSKSVFHTQSHPCGKLYFLSIFLLFCSYWYS